MRIPSLPHIARTTTTRTWKISLSRHWLLQTTIYKDAFPPYLLTHSPLEKWNKASVKLVYWQPVATSLCHRGLCSKLSLGNCSRQPHMAQTESPLRPTAGGNFRGSAQMGPN
ncbi:hypothetical protein IscW_ISCW002776 [Ixodes scapularis]|uniref:Uncharacterized protein n=1 Tax=Ixodes scapularis TaxID=6945 RepID=B7P8L3_IXOSC|nr:hypothetical protein IscW_ISCW002776 [Ixodes scapularis]|eukprot:XP_002402474.1 hypothetical protein IscW_ISCW002776 [Ixodes scapularis]